VGGKGFNGFPSEGLMPSRQERRKAERDAAKRAPGQAGAGGAGGAAAARANVNMNPVGDWTTQAEDPYVLFHAIGAHVVKQRAGAGDREARWSLGYWLLSAADGMCGSELGAGGRSPKKADAGFAFCTAHFPGLSPDCDACGPIIHLRLQTLGGGGHGASGAGGGARARVRYVCGGKNSRRQEGAQTSRGMVHQRRRGRVAESYVLRRVLPRRGAGRGGAGLPGGGGLVQARGRRRDRGSGREPLRHVHSRPR